MHFPGAVPRDDQDPAADGQQAVQTMVEQRPAPREEGRFQTAGPAGAAGGQDHAVNDHAAALSCLRTVKTGISRGRGTRAVKHHDITWGRQTASLLLKRILKWNTLSLDMSYPAARTACERGARFFRRCCGLLTEPRGVNPLLLFAPGVSRVQEKRMSILIAPGFNPGPGFQPGEGRPEVLHPKPAFSGRFLFCAPASQQESVFHYH